MNKEVLKSVLADNQNEVPRHEVIPRKFRFEEFFICLRHGDTC